MSGRSRLRFCAPALLFAAGVAFLVGCEQGVRRIPVSGTVMLDDKPLDRGVLMFHPDESKGNKVRASCTGPISNGRFNLVTSGVTKKDTGSGAPLGWYKVTLLNDIPGMQVVNVHKKYLTPEETPLAIEIVDDPKPGQYDLKMYTNK